MPQQPMPKIAFKMMQLVMALKRGGKDIIDAEITALDLRSGDAVLDYGCGPGYNTIPAAQLVGPNGKVHAVDVTPDALKVMKKKAAAQQLTNITTRLSDCDTGLDSASVDAVFLHNVLPMTERPKDVLHEIVRVLKPGGKLSYKSGGGARLSARNSMSDAEVGAYLEQELGFTVRTRQGGHIVFIR